MRREEPGPEAVEAAAEAEAGLGLLGLFGLFVDCEPGLLEGDELLCFSATEVMIFVCFWGW